MYMALIMVLFTNSCIFFVFSMLLIIWSMIIQIFNQFSKCNQFFNFFFHYKKTIRMFCITTYMGNLFNLFIALGNSCKVFGCSITADFMSTIMAYGCRVVIFDGFTNFFFFIISIRYFSINLVARNSRSSFF